MPPNQYWYCRIGMYIVMSCTMYSNHLIVSMAFQRFYSIVRPHHAASFNTVKRAKFFIGSIVIFSLLYCSPHLLVTYFLGRYCIPYAKILDKMSGQFYYWLTFVLNFVIPFVSLVIMNTVIIKTLYRRSKSNLTETIKIRKEDQNENSAQGEKGQGQTNQMKTVERQIYTILLLVTFSFLILSTPSYAMMLYSNFVDHFQSPYHFAAYILFVQVGDKAASTNFGINFFLYVLSGKKFRRDLVDLSVLRSSKNWRPEVTTSEINTISSTLHAIKQEVSP